MGKSKVLRFLWTLLPLILLTGGLVVGQPSLKVDWTNVVRISRSTPTLQVVTNPMLRKGAAMHDGAFGALKQLQADYVRYVPWYPYPKLAVAELRPPTATKTFWDFSLIDEATIDFLEATKGHPVIMNFSTIPQWMFKTQQPVKVPKDPNQVYWGYGGGQVFRDTTLKELTDYYTRLISWYTKGGFTDELGKYHRSGYHYDFPYWEVLNEPDLEHHLTPAQYTKVYDAMVAAIRKILPDVKFVGLAIAEDRPGWFEYFLNPANHKPGIPLDMISYHCYARAGSEQPFEDYEYALFNYAERFVHAVRYIENIRNRLSPQTKTDINELGAFVSGAMRQRPIAAKFWNLSASVYAYFFIELSKAGIDIIGESQLVGYPSQFPDVSMISYVNNKPNPRFRVLQLIKDNFQAGDEMVKTQIIENRGDDLLAQAYVDGPEKRVLLLNKRSKETSILICEALAGARVSIIDSTTGDNAPKQFVLKENNILKLQPFAVAVVQKSKP